MKGYRAFLLCGLFLLTLVSSAHLEGPSFVRIVRGMPDYPGLWYLCSDGKHLYVGGVPVELKQDGGHSLITKIQSPPPMHVIVIEPKEERVIATKQVDEVFWPIRNTQYIEAALSGTLGWPREKYDYWIIANGMVYALSPMRRNSPEAYRWDTVYQIEPQTHTIKRQVRLSVFLPSSNEGGHQKIDFIYVLTTSPQGNWLFTGHPGRVGVWSLPDLKLTAFYHYETDHNVEEIYCTPDGSRLYVLIYPFEVLEVSLSDLRACRVGAQPTALRSRRVHLEPQMTAMVPSPDWRELYVVQRAGHQDGRVLAIDLATRKVVRRLKLSDKACISAVVVGSKLFVSALDGVYVIDIDAWRKNPQVTQVEVK